MTLRLTLLAAALASTGAFAAERIVSTAGNASEIVAKLGKADALAGVDTTSKIPADVMEKKPKIGYRRQLSAEGILSLNPDLILLAPDAGPEAAVTQIKEAGVPILQLKDSQTLEGIRQDITAIGDAIGAADAAKALNAEIEQDEKTLDTTKAASKHGSALVLINAGGQGSFALGKNSAGSHLLDIIGLENAFTADGSKPLAPEVLASTDASVILATGRNTAGAPVIEKAGKDITPELAVTQAGKTGCVFNVNILAALGFGWDTAKNADTILRAIQPCLSEKIS